MTEQLKNEVAGSDATNTGNELTAAQQVELEKARAERAQAELKTKEVELKSAELNAANIQLRFETNFSDGLRESGCEFYLTPSQLRKMLDGSPDCGGISIAPGADGRVVAERDGQRVPLKDALREYGSAHPEMLKNANDLLLDPSLVRSKSQFKSNEQKSAFITRNGAAAYERLPQHPARKLDLDTITGTEWRKLPTSEKCRLIAAGAKVSKIVRRG